MKFRHFSAFVAIVETGSLRAAAARLKLSQPALTKTIRELETLLGVPLVHRTVRGTFATPTGEVFLVRARAVLEEARRARDEISQLAGSGVGVVRIGLSVGASLLCSGDAIVSFMQNRPTAELHVVQGLFEQLISGVRQGRLDFSVGGTSSQADDRELDIEPLFAAPVRPAARHGHPMLNARSCAELVSYPWAVSNDESEYVINLASHLVSQGIEPPQVSLRSESVFTLLELAPRSDMIVALPSTLLDHPLIAAHLAPIDVQESLPTVGYSLIRKANVPLTPLANELATKIRAVMKSKKP
jgi:LysR family transcriptional regulator of abg operon